MPWTVTDASGNQNAPSVPQRTTKRSRDTDVSKRAHKRKRAKHSSAAPKSNQRVSVDMKSINALQGWSKIRFPSDMPFSDGAAGGYLDLEEIDDVDVVTEETADGQRLIKFEASDEATMAIFDFIF